MITKIQDDKIRKDLIIKNIDKFDNYTIEIGKYKEIFDKLDEDKDGLISYDNLNVKEIEIEDLLKISSLINEIKNKKLTTLSFEDFKILTQQFYI